MKRIPLTQGQFAIVDEEDYDRINSRKWCAAWHESTKSFYAVSGRGRGNQRQLRMHREVVNAPYGMLVDHINHDTIDNRKANLRLCTNSQNLANRGISVVNSSGFKGVSWHKQKSKWRATLYINNKETHVGYYNTPLEAAIAYDIAASEKIGEFALTNKQLGLIQLEY